MNRNFRDELAIHLYGKTVAEAHYEGVCIQCGGDPVLNNYSVAGDQEYLISGLCELCFDEITKEEEAE